MAISMQGAWTVSVHSRNADFPQRFIISGATTGNGIYNGVTSTPAVFVTGESWSIRIEHDPGSGFISSTEQITFPTVVGPNVQFDIQSNDSGGDLDFNDLILRCTTPQSATEFVIYGHVSSYSGRCIFNPCNFPFVVIDSAIALETALKNPVLRVPIEKLYRERIFIPKPPLPDPPPLFEPLVIPIQGETALPPKLGQVVRMEKAAAARTKDVEPQGGRARVVRSLTLSTPARLAVDYDRVAVAGVFDKLRLFCNTTPLPGYGLRFQEYDRTAAELAGGPFTGTGNRENLGVCSTDHNGNYIFRFSRTIGDFINEGNIDTALGEDETVQAMPDVIAQVLDTTVPGGVAYQSAPYWNIGNLRRINLCVPSGSVRPPVGCQGGRVLQRIGHIPLTSPLTTFDNGRVTCTDNSLADIPQARCAAWGGVLRFSGCFLKPDGTDGPVEWYTIQHRRWLSPGWSPWEFYQEELKLRQVGVILPVQIGPFDRELDVPDVGVIPNAKAYQNIELDGAWEAADWFVKAVLNSSIYAPSPGMVEFRIQGYNGGTGAGSREVNHSDTRTLFIDNTPPDFDILSVSMGSQTGGDCALFHLSGEPVPARLTVEWKAQHAQGFLASYAMTVRKGNIGNFPIVHDAGYAPISDSYSAPVGTCIDFTGTPGLVVTDIKPASGNWLGAEPFCTFAVQVSASKRVTNGTNGPVISFGTAEYFLGIEQ